MLACAARARARWTQVALRERAGECVGVWGVREGVGVINKPTEALQLLHASVGQLLQSRLQASVAKPRLQASGRELEAAKHAKVGQGSFRWRLRRFAKLGKVGGGATPEAGI